ncbi:MAG: hypothetical protein KY395_00590 [Actinobacteria bacterium]|nr:hypothetical protein [Actinomycetota bacterium]
MMRRLRGIVTMAAGVSLLAGSGALGSTTVGAEAVLENYGWWYKANQFPDDFATPPAPPAPPGASSDGLYIARDPSGPFALGAVRYVAEGPGTLTLEFSEDGQSGIPSIGACVALTTWDGASAGRWDARPEYDCVNQAEGVVSEDGATMTFEVTPTLQRVLGVYDLALVPQGPVPFTASFNAPRGSSMVTEGGGSEEAFPSTSEPPAQQEPAGFGGGDQFGSFDTTFPVIDESRSTTAAPGVAPPPTADVPIRSGAQPVAVTRPLALPDDRNERMAAVAGLALLLLGAWWFGGRTVRPPRLLGSVAGRARALEVSAESAPSGPVRGIGRFARPRSS